MLTKELRLTTKGVKRRKALGILMRKQNTRTHNVCIDS